MSVSPQAPFGVTVWTFACRRLRFAQFVTVEEASQLNKYAHELDELCAHSSSEPDRQATLLARISERTLESRRNIAAQAESILCEL